MARVRIAANTANGKRIEIRRSPFGAFSMYPFYHTVEYMEAAPDFWLKPRTPNRLGWKPSGLRWANRYFEGVSKPGKEG